MDATDLGGVGSQSQGPTVGRGAEVLSRSQPAAVIVAVVALLLVGCGGGTEERAKDLTDEAPLTPAAMVGSIGSGGDITQVAGSIDSPVFLEQQAMALRPEFRDIIDQLEEVPRYDITATVNLTEAVVTGHLRVLYTNTSNGSLTELEFRLLGNAAPLYGSGRTSVSNVQAGGMDVEPIMEQDGVVMRVRLVQLLEPGETELIETDFTTEVAKRVAPGYGILAQTGAVTRLSGWYPMMAPYEGTWQTPKVPVVGDATLGDTSVYRVALTAPASYDVVSTGVTIAQDSRKQQVVWHIVSGPARDFSLAISDAFEQRQDSQEGVTITVHALPSRGQITSIETGLSMIRDAFTVYESRFGPYPWIEFDVVETEISIEGYELSEMIFVDSRLRVQGSYPDYRYIVAHETAHQWWYNLVGDNQIIEPWLDEAFATYSASIYLGDVYGAGAAAGLLQYWRGQYGLRVAGDPPVDSAALDFSSWAKYRKTVYIHGAFFLDALRGEMGDAAFFRLLQADFSLNRFKWATTTEFLELAQQMTESDLGPLIDRWFK
jgi:hypothetical protein